MQILTIKKITANSLLKIDVIFFQCKLTQDYLSHIRNIVYTVTDITSNRIFEYNIATSLMVRI